MTNRAQVFCAVSGPIALTLFLLAMWPASHFLPPPAPGLTAIEVANVYRSHATGIQIAAILQMVSIALLVAFYGGISAQMRRMEGNDRTWTYVQLGAGAMSLAPFLLCGLLWAAAAIRIDRALSSSTILLSCSSLLRLRLPPCSSLPSAMPFSATRTPSRFSRDGSLTQPSGRQY
jgi:hypothetical protein